MAFHQVSRIYLTPTQLSILRSRSVVANPRWVQLIAEADAADNALEHNFLTILHPTSIDDSTAPDCTSVTAANMTGCRIVKNSSNCLLLFSSDASGNPPTGTISYNFPQSGTTSNILYDLIPRARYVLTAMGTLPIL